MKAVQLLVSCLYLVGSLMWLTSAARAADWQRINIGGGGAMNSAAAGPTGTLVATTDLAGAYIKRPTDPQWQMIGPQNGIDDTHALAIAFDASDANIILISTEGGLYRSTDEGNSFTRVDRDSAGSPDFFGGKYLALAYQQSTTVPSASRRVYASHVSNYRNSDARILRSDDGGRTFRFMTPLPRPADAAITRIVIHPTDPDRLLALSARERYLDPTNALYMSTDGGSSWFDIATDFQNITDVVFHPLPPFQTFISSKPAFGTARVDTSNLGDVENSGDDVWDSVFLTPPYNNQHYQPTLMLWPDSSAANTLRAINIRTTWQFSAQTAWRLVENNGSWQQQPLGQSSDWTGDEADWQLGWSKKFTILAPTLESINHTIGFDLSDPDRLLWATNQFVHHGEQVAQGNGYTMQFENLTTTGSDTTGWSSRGLDNITPFIIEVNAANPDVLYAGLNDVGCVVSRDAGSSWNLCVHDSGDWREGFDFIKSYGGVTTALVSDPNNAAKLWMFAAGDQGDPVVPLRSNDYGANWQQTSRDNTQGETPDVFGLSVDPNSAQGQRRLFVTINGAVYRSEDDGSNWSQVFACNLGCRDTAVGTNGWVYAGGEAGLFYSRDAGASWTPVLSQTRIEGFLIDRLFRRGRWGGVSGIAVDPTQPAVIYAAIFSESPSQGVYRCDVSDSPPATTDCQRMLTGTRYVRDIAIDPFNGQHLFATSSSADTSGGFNPNSAGVLRSTDGGNTWSALNSGLAWPMAYPVAGDPQDSNKLYTGSPGGGYYKLTLSDQPATCTGSYALPTNQWRQISLPCAPGANDSPNALFGDDGLQVYGTDWIMYAYDPTIDLYADVGVDGTLRQGEGYWIIQTSGSTQTLDMPSGSAATPVVTDSACSGAACLETSVATEAGTNQWNMIGYPFPVPVPVNTSRIRTASGSCVGGCTPAAASAHQLMAPVLWSYNGIDGFDGASDGDNLNPWTGYWLNMLDAADTTAPVSVLIPEP